MGSEGTEAEEGMSSWTPKLPKLLSNSIPGGMQYSPEPESSGMLTPPLYTLASVPFRWEEEPGKPRHCTTLCNNNIHAGPDCLELPPRLCMESKLTKTPSPTTVLDGPYVGVGRPIFHSSSFRFRKDDQRRRRGSFGSSSSLSPERGQLGPMVLGNKEKRGFFGRSWGQRALKIKDGDDDTTTSTRVKMTRITRNGSFTSLSQSQASWSHLCAAIYKGFKLVIPRSRKSTKEGLII